MATRKKANAPAETDVTVRATPDTQITVEASKRGAAGAGLIQVIRDNPVPAGMMWAGLGWLVLSSSGAKRQQKGGPEEGAAALVGRTQETVSQVATGAQEAVTAVASGAGDRARSIAARARETGAAARTRATSTASAARERATTGAQRVAENLQRVVTEQPEALELGALAAGAAVGLAIPASRRERELIAPQRDQIVQKLDTVASQAVDKVQEVVEPQ